MKKAKKLEVTLRPLIQYLKYLKKDGTWFMWDANDMGTDTREGIIKCDYNTFMELYEEHSKMFNEGWILVDTPAILKEFPVVS